jgi:hypothetical protein
MKKLGIALLILVVLVAIAITFTIGWRPFIGPRMRPVTNRCAWIATRRTTIRPKIGR